MGSNASGLSLQTWTWPTEQLSDDAVRIVLQIIEGLGSSHPSRSRVAQGSVTADLVSLSYVEAKPPILADWIESESMSPRAALVASAGLVAGLSDCEERGVAIGRWDPAFINETEDGGWSLPTPGIHGLPMGSRPLIVSLTEAAACAPEASTGGMELSSCTPVQRARAEAYALGATLYWALSGQLPLQADTPEQYCRAQLESTPKPLLEVAPHLERYATLILLVDRCLARSPEERPQSHEELTRELSIAAREADRLENSVSFFPLRVSDSVGMDLPPRKHPATDSRELVLTHNQRQLWVLIILIGILLFLGYYQAHSPEMASPQEVPALVPEAP